MAKQLKLKNKRHDDMLRVDSEFDMDNEVFFNVITKGSDTGIYLSKKKVKKLRDHLNKLLRE